MPCKNQENIADCKFENPSHRISISCMACIKCWLIGAFSGYIPTVWPIHATIARPALKRVSKGSRSRMRPHVDGLRWIGKLGFGAPYAIHESEQNFLANP